jgi:predicted RNase H-like HicB family nuclease
VNSQGRTKKELLENLRSALKEALQMNRKASRASLPAEYEKVSIEVGNVET